MKIGDTPPHVKSMGPRLVREAKPPKLDPYAWITPAETATVSRVWTLPSGTNVTASLQKFNGFTVLIRTADDKEVRLLRKTLNEEGQKLIDALEAEAKAESDAAWRAFQEEKAEQEESLRPKVRSR